MASCSLKSDECDHRLFFESSSDGMVLTDGNGSILDVNPSACRMLKRLRETLIGVELKDIFDPSYPVLEAVWERLHTTGRGYVSARMVCEDGSSSPVSVTVSDGGGEEGRLYVVLRETGQRSGEKAQEASRTGAAEYRAMVEGAMDAMLVCDLDNTFRYVNPALARIMGYEPDEMVGMFVPDIIHPGDLARAAEVNVEIQNTPEPCGPYEIRYRRRDGSWVCLETTLNNLAEDPEVRAVVAICRDVTGRKRAEEDLKASEERFRALVENAHDFIALASAENVALYANPSIERIMGYTPEEFVGTFIGQYIHPDDVEAGLANVAGSLARPGPHTLETLRYVHKDGSTVWLEVTVNNQLENPAVRGVICNCRDVTERVEAEERLRESEERFRSLIENAHDFVVLADENNIARYASPAIEQTLGYTPEEFVGTVISGYGHPDEAEAALARIAETVPVSGPQTLGTWRYRHRDGSYRWLEVVVNNRFDDPNLRGAVCNCRDVTARVKAEEELRKSEEWHRALNENALDFVVVQRPDNTLAYASPSVERLLGYTPEEVVDSLGADYIHPEDLEWAWPLFYEQLQKPGGGITETVTIRYRHRDGRWRWFESACNNQLDNPAISGLVFNCRDVTERIEAEEEVRRLNEDLERRVEERTAQFEAAAKEAGSNERMLRESEERFRLLAEGAVEGISLSENGSVFDTNDSFLKMFGYGPHEAVGMDIVEFLAPEDREAVSERVSSGDVGVYETRGLKKDGIVFPVEIRPRMLPYSGRDVRVSSVFDLSERKEAEEALRRSEKLYRTVIEQAVESVFLADPGTKRILEANSAFHLSLGYSAHETTGLTFYDIVDEDREALDASVRRLCRERRFVGERRYRRRDGSMIDVEVSATMVPYGDGEVLCVVAHDVTERKRSEAGLRRSLDMLLALHEAGRILGSTLELEEVGPRLLKVMRRVSDLTAAVVHVRDDDRRWHVWHTIGPDELWRSARRSPEAISARWMALQIGEHRSFQMRDQEAPAGLCLPLRVRDRVIGVLEVYGPEELVEKDTTEMLRSLAAQAASALENARLYRELSQREQRLQELVGKILVAQEEERKRVAYEVHDGLAQVASATHQHLQAYARRHPPDSEKGVRDLQKILNLVRQTVSDARLIIANLRPTALDDLGLASALSLKVAELRDAGWQIEFQESLGEERLPVSVETAFFRIAQEALTNAQKHAGTRLARITLSRTAKDRITLEVRDWGLGFDLGAPMGEGGPGERVGLSGMRERVVMLGGRFEIRSSPGEGTSVFAEAPLPAQADGDSYGS